MFPFGASSAWSKAQRAEWIQMAALSISRGRHIGYTCLSGFFPRFAKKQQAANTREDIPTMEVEHLQRSHQNRKLHENDFHTCDDFDWTF